MLNACNRALRFFYNNVKITKTARLVAHGVRPVTHYKMISCKGGDEITLPVNGVAYSMRVHGTGRILVSDSTSSNVERFDSPIESKVIKGFLPLGGTITLWSSFSFTVYDFSVYDRLFSEKKEDIPDYGPTVVMDLREILTDFMSFISPPIDRDGVPLENCRMQNGRLEIDSAYKGEIMLTYRRMPAEIGGEEDDIIDVPDEYLHIFPLLVAHYFLLRIDDTMAKYYKSLYDKSMELVAKDSYSEMDYRYPVRNGWA